MRTALEELHGERLRFAGKFGKVSVKTGTSKNRDTTFLLLDIVRLDTNEVIADHVWVASCKALDRFQLRPGDNLTFNAKVSRYRKRYGRNDDYTLSKIGKVRITCDEVTTV